MFIPIRTETSVHRAPSVNFGLIIVNMIIFIWFDVSPTKSGMAFKDAHFILNGEWPSVYQLFTYQFAHADIWHLVGNMLFLWVFGNAVNSKLGNLPYLLFYLSGGAFAAIVFGWNSTSSLLGASGSIAAVTTAYLALFPRSHVTVLVVFFIIRFFEIPATIFIGFKIILWDNILAPQLAAGPGEVIDQVAYSAHLAGYVFGLIIPLLMLRLRVIPRDQFDMLALLKRWHQRREFAAAMARPEARARAKYGRVARIELIKSENSHSPQTSERAELRTSISQHIRQGNINEAVSGYEKLIGIDETECLPADQQIVVARNYYATSRFPQAAAAFERFINNYKTHSEANEIRLLLGIIAARDLHQYETARKHLSIALEQATNPNRKEQARKWLDQLPDSNNDSSG